MPLDAFWWFDAYDTVREWKEVFVSKKESEGAVSRDLQAVIETNLWIKWIRDLRIFNNYLVDSITWAEFDRVVETTLSEAPVDDFFDRTNFSEIRRWKKVIVIESNPGQFDNRVDWVVQNLALQTWRLHNVRSKKVIVIDGDLTDDELAKIKKMLINPVETYEASLEDKSFDRKITAPENHRVLTWFTQLQSDQELQAFIKEHELSINLDDVRMVLWYFRNFEHRDPTMAEMLLIDTYWSDHCRHTTFNTRIDNVEIDWVPWLVKEVEAVNDFFKAKSQELWKDWNTFMEIAQASFRFLKNNPEFKWKDFLDVSIEDNAASYKTEVEMEDWTKETWIIMFKNETHNSPTEVEPFGWAATCLGWAIRDTLSWRAYTFQAMRISGSWNPTEPISETLAWKLSQRAISIWAALWYSSYWNQIWLATWRVQEYFHPWYKAKRFECWYVLAAVREANIKREKPAKWDLVIMFGWRTWRDGVGWANVSSKEWWASSEAKTWAHIQKWNPVLERAIQRLMLNPDFTKLIKKSNDFWAWWVSVAIWELARWIDINLDEVARYTKYEWLSDEELLIAESQERMSIVIASEHYWILMEFLIQENIEWFQVWVITNDENNPESDRLKIGYEWKDVVNLSRAFLDTNWAERTANAKINLWEVTFFEEINSEVKALLDEWEIDKAILKQLSLLWSASQRWLWSIFDASVWASSILAPFWWKYQNSPQIWMASKIPTFTWVDAKTAIISTNGFNPYLMEQNTFIWWIYSVIEAVSRAVAMWWDREKTWVSLQEYFGKLTTDEKFGEVYAGLLWTLKALIELKIAAIWWKDSMSWTTTLENWEKLSVPPTIVTFANTPVNSDNIRSAEFKWANNEVLRFRVKKDENWMPDFKDYLEKLKIVEELIKSWRVYSSSVVDASWLVWTLAKMSLWNRVWIEIDDSVVWLDELFTPSIWDIILEIEWYANWFEEYIIWKTRKSRLDLDDDHNLDDDHITYKWVWISARDTKEALEWTLEWVWSTKQIWWEVDEIPEFSARADLILSNPELLARRPVALLPIFPGTNSELDTKHALLRAWFDVIEHVFYTPKLWVWNDNIELGLAKASRMEFAENLSKSSLLVFPGWFSGWDEPDGSAKFIANMMRSKEIKEAFQAYLDRTDSLTLWICNWFQWLIKLWVFNNWKVNDKLWENDSTLTFNNNSRHITWLVWLKVRSILSPFARWMKTWDRFMIPVSHGEWRIFIPDRRTIDEFIEKWQIPLQYIDEMWRATNKYNWSEMWIAWLTDPTWRIMWMMPHPERTWINVFKNVPWNRLMSIFNWAYESLMSLRK